MNRQTMNQFRDSKNSTGIKVPQELHDRCSPWLAQLISPSFTNRIEMDEHQDEGSLSAACSTSTNDEFVSTTPGDSKSRKIYLLKKIVNRREMELLCFHVTISMNKTVLKRRKRLLNRS